MKTFALALAIGVVSTGCWATTVRNGRPPGQTPFGYDEKWHSGFIFGIAEMSGPYNLAEICPGGWSEIRTETSVWNAIVNFVTRDIYTTQTIGITCAQVPRTPPATAPSPPPIAVPPEPAAEAPPPPE